MVAGEDARTCTELFLEHAALSYCMEASFVELLTLRSSYHDASCPLRKTTSTAYSVHTYTVCAYSTVISFPKAHQSSTALRARIFALDLDLHRTEVRIYVYMVCTLSSTYYCTTSTNFTRRSRVFLHCDERVLVGVGGSQRACLLFGNNNTKWASCYFLVLLVFYSFCSLRCIPLVPLLFLFRTLWVRLSPLRNSFSTASDTLQSTC